MSIVFRVIAPRLLGPALLLAAALIVKGYTDVGDGFSAGVIVGLAISLRYVTLGPAQTERGLPILRHAPAGVACGLLIALAVGFGPVLAGDPPFTHIPRPGEEPVQIGTLELISAVAFDAGLFLLVASAMVLLIHHLASMVVPEEP